MRLSIICFLEAEIARNYKEYKKKADKKYALNIIKAYMIRLLILYGMGVTITTLGFIIGVIMYKIPTSVIDVAPTMLHNFASMIISLSISFIGVYLIGNHGFINKDYYELSKKKNTKKIA